MADHIPQLYIRASIDLLIGRDLISAHHGLDHWTGPEDQRYAQKSPLGWVIIGDVCLERVHRSEVANVNKTFTFSDGRTTLLDPCEISMDFRPTSRITHGWCVGANDRCIAKNFGFNALASQFQGHNS